MDLFLMIVSLLSILILRQLARRKPHSRGTDLLQTRKEYEYFSGVYTIQNADECQRGSRSRHCA